jgi:arsenite methyltransferase
MASEILRAPPLAGKQEEATVTDQAHDPWAKWVLDQWFGSDPERYKAVIEGPNPVRERVLQNARINEGDVVLDIGAGAGLIAFNAAKQVGEHGRVTVRSVLIYIADKQKAFDEFHRVLKPGGRLSIFEPINRFGYPEPPGQFGGCNVSPVWDVAQKVRALYERLQPAESDPMMNFDERDLLRQAEQACFPDIHLELQVSVVPPPQLTWDTFLHFAGNPKIPSFEEAMRQVLTPGETERLVAHLRPLVEAGKGVQRSAVTYLRATK